MVKCPHAASGCDYPAGEYSGRCTSKRAEILQLADLLEKGHHLFHAERKKVGAHLRRLHDENKLLKATQYGSGRLQELRDVRDKLQARLDAANQACNEMAIELEKVRRERDHWYARLLAEVGKRNKSIN